MRPIVNRVERFGGRHGWANRVLRVDLSAMTAAAEPAEPHLPHFLGGRGLAARLCWLEVAEPPGWQSPANPLMVFPGALTGSRAPYSGRSSVCAFSPQGYPHPWFTRSNVGGYVGGALKRAGYDGLVVTGAAERPVRLCIRDDEVTIAPAGELWGLDTMETLAALESAEGELARSLVIGPAGERLSRIATIQTASSSACGQGGLGAVMGSKKLKAITVAGTGRVTLASPERVTAIARALARVLAEDGVGGPMILDGGIQAFDRELAAAGDGRARLVACTDGCLTPCVLHVEGMPGETHRRSWSGDWFCVGRDFAGHAADDPPHKKAIFGWQLGRRAAFELNVLSNRYGLNQSDLLGGMVPWLIACQRAGLIAEMDGRPIDWGSPTFWDVFLHAIAYREGMGEALADGGWAAANALGLGRELARARYPGWGYASHCDPWGWSAVTFPYWLVSALQWLADTRDPFDSGHGYLWAESAAEQAFGRPETERAAALERLRALGERVYGSAEAVDPTSGYRGKAAPAAYQAVRSAIKDCLPVDAHFPLIYRPAGPDLFYRFQDVEGIGDLDGPSVEYHLFVAGTGVEWSEEEFNRAAERVCALERALQVRHWGRDRALDESVLAYFEPPEPVANPWLGWRQALDRARFKPLLDEFYTRLGWDVERGWPTEERLRELGLEEVYRPMVEGAGREG